MIHALANERLARHLVGIGSVEQAEVFFRKACTLYAEWGGEAKAVRLQAEVDSIVLVGRSIQFRSFDTKLTHHRTSICEHVSRLDDPETYHSRFRSWLGVTVSQISLGSSEVGTA